MTDRNKQLNIDRKLEAVAFLRDSDMKNKERLLHVNRILSGEAPSSGAAGGSYTGYKNDMEHSARMGIEETSTKAETDFWRSFRNRMMIALLLTGILYVGMMSKDASVMKYISQIKATISVDYSENLFDFINHIPYTLDYEKINA